MSDLKIVTVPMLDTGIGREAGFDSDAHLIEVAKAERAALPPETRALMDEIDAKVDRAIPFGE